MSVLTEEAGGSFVGPTNARNATIICRNTYSKAGDARFELVTDAEGIDYEWKYGVCARDQWKAVTSGEGRC